jgi:hypothetical protein
MAENYPYHYNIPFIIIHYDFVYILLIVRQRVSRRRKCGAGRKGGADSAGRQRGGRAARLGWLGGAGGIRRTLFCRYKAD